MSRLLVVIAFALTAACGTSPQQACKDIVAATCEKTFACYTGAEIDAIKLVFGSTAAECTTKLTASARCDQSTVCEGGKTYDSVQAGTCTSEYKALTCDKLKAGMTPTSCNTVCK